MHWFRNDLRLRDNTALDAAVRASDAVLPVFVLDDRLLRGPHAGAPRSRFLLDCLDRLADELDESDCPLILRRGDPEQILPRLAREAGVDRVFSNEDVSPYARARDARVDAALGRADVAVTRCQDRMIQGVEAIRTGAGDAYSVYSPYRKKWRQELDEPAPGRKPRLQPFPEAPDPQRSLLDVCRDEVTGAEPIELPTGGEAAARRRLEAFLDATAGGYEDDRNRPDRDGTSRLSPYLRFGVISPRTCVARALEASREDRRAAGGIQTWIDQLVWRDFYQAILAENPHVLRHNHRREYDALVWEEDPEGFEAWCEGRTGFPIVDAGMRQLAETGWMHNRVRMIVASFLTKDLLIDWRRGERFFFRSLVDGDPANNNGGWQWSASTGTDAQPYFRIFNPTAQGKRWDPAGEYVREWIPELRDVAADRIHEPWRDGDGPSDYPKPIVDHGERRELALAAYKRARAIGKVGKAG
ncbi:MAG: deoxyribodipyrimidine photo-lyase, partial [Myxococcales bacterium]|nr:deoxyribodipyrimidine photo-lyase [Myxococcales bacterium]